MKQIAGTMVIITGFILVFSLVGCADDSDSKVYLTLRITNNYDAPITKVTAVNGEDTYETDASFSSIAPGSTRTVDFRVSDHLKGNDFNVSLHASGLLEGLGYVSLSITQGGTKNLTLTSEGSITN